MTSLVDYSSSESDDPTEEPPSNARPVSKLPMLLKVEENKKSNKNSEEDHQMRIRSFEHVEGNWATHVYIDCKLSTFIS